MADERDRWLDEAAVERLLRGEPVEPVGPAADPRARDRAARLRAALDALAERPPAGAELPGEAAAVAAFRAARGPAVPPSERPAAASGHDEPLVALGRPLPLSAPRGRRPARPVRFGLAAALASVAVGGLAAAVGAGLLDGPRHDSAGPGPAMSVSVDGDPEPAGSQDPTLGPNLRPTPLRDGEGGPRLTGGPQTPGADGSMPPGTGTAAGASSGAPATGGSGKDAQGGLGGGDGKDGNGDREGRGDGGDTNREGFTAGTDKERDGERESRLRNIDLCRDYRAGRLSDDRRDRLARLASGVARIPRYCEAMLDGLRDGTREGAPGETGSGGTGDSGSTGDSGAKGTGDSGAKGTVLRAPLLGPVLSGGSTGLFGGR
ncbi:hypothetical protein [Streptomyces sp. NBC_01408]|uniref:hypothetical protein n=1 Tax=Streptomyces sp. NBC_01408 TaxID=2903855 RepID=UPI00224F25A0|nr:hypothetical protein [Streptomyces sp. NBC_01408]MCX4691429.1 hypothetical protein [Streptomyces sp. NBC_01408]